MRAVCVTDTRPGIETVSHSQTTVRTQAGTLSHLTLPSGTDDLNNAFYNKKTQFKSTLLNFFLITIINTVNKQ